MSHVDRSSQPHASHQNEQRPGRIQRLLRWFFGSPFQEMPEPFGDPVPPEIREFEAESDRLSNTPVRDVASPHIGHTRTKPARKNKYRQ